MVALNPTTFTPRSSSDKTANNRHNAPNQPLRAKPIIFFFAGVERLRDRTMPEIAMILPPLILPTHARALNEIGTV